MATALKIENRLFPRFKLKEEGLLVSKSMIGLVDEISLGGLSFRYFYKGQPPLSNKPFELILPFERLAISPANYRIVKEQQLGGEGKKFSRQVIRYHIQFLNLSGLDLKNLWRIIKKHCRSTLTTTPHTPKRTMKASPLPMVVGSL